MTARDRRRALKDAARDVCPICGGRARGDAKMGPNEAGNYTHGGRLCPATAIWTRLKYEAMVGGRMPACRVSEEGEE